MKTEEIEKIVNEKILKLFYKLIDLKPIKVTNSSFFYNLNGEIFELGISQYTTDKNDGYKFPELHRSSMFMLDSFRSFNISDKWGFYIKLPNGICDKESYHARQLRIPAFEEIELLHIKEKLLLQQQVYELTLLDKYLDNSSELPF